MNTVNSSLNNGSIISPELLISTYSIGVFPMSRSRKSREILWIEPKERAIIKIGELNINRSIVRAVKKFEIRINTSFDSVIRLCAESRKDSWINHSIEDNFCQLHRMGYAHSFEAWRGDKLCGGLYGLSLGGVFFGESMFSLESGASKAAIVKTDSVLKELGYTMIDCQFPTKHLTSLGAITIKPDQYKQMLSEAVSLKVAPFEAEIIKNAS